MKIQNESEDVFCEESIKVLLQFLRSQLGHDKSFWSYDGNINYTQEQQDNFELPIFSVIGNLDKIVPAETIEDVLNLPKPKNKKVARFDQGHLGIIFHHETVQSITKQADEWIRDL